MASRRKARELALQMLFQWEQGKHSPQHVVQSFLRMLKTDPDVEQFAQELFEGTVAEKEVLDRLVREQTENWRLERMAAVDRNLLRLAAYELVHHPETPPAVVINEAVEIARRYSDKDSVDFVNGVLDAIHKKLACMPTKS
ncbi:MAG: transcription antitermination factor NusB [Acidobacteria bacterium]|nr:transcription antitermination factor NusB [Acidobacteriota bacterium]